MANTTEHTPSIRAALVCSEPDFPVYAANAVFGTNPTVEQILDIHDWRAAGKSRAAVLRSLIRLGERQNRPLPDDWGLVVPRQIDVSTILSAPTSKADFIKQAYEAILQRSPSAEEIAAQLNAWRWPATRSDFLVAMSQCAEAGPDITLTGLGRCVVQLFRRIKRNPKDAAAFGSSGDSEVTRLYELLTHLADQVKTLADQVKTGENLALLRSEQGLSVNRQVAAIENTLSRLRVRMETEGAKTSEIACDAKVMLELIRELATRMDLIAETVRAIPDIAQRSDEMIAISRRMKELPTEVHSIGGVMAQAVASASQAESAVTDLAKRILPPVIPGGDTVVTQVDGFFVGVPVSEWRLSTYYHHCGPLEPGVYKLFQTLIRPGMTVVDVGANVGLYTLLAARSLNGVGLVFGFEPNPRTFGVLRNNVQLNGFLESGVVRLYNTAVSAESGKMALFSDTQDSTHDSLFPAPGQAFVTEVPTIALDELLSDQTHVDVVKIDAEGSEPRVFRGMRKLITGNPEIRIVLEFAPEHISRSGVRPEDFLTEMRSCGLLLRTVDDLTGALSPASDHALLSSLNTNVLVSRK